MTYPPEQHVLRDIPFEMEQVDGTRARAYLELTGPTVQAGAPDPGPVMTAVDVLAGSLVGRVVAPDWMATAELALHLSEELPSTGELVADATVIRDGRTTIVLDARLRSGGSDVGEVMLTFVRLPKRDSTIDLSSFPVAYGERSGFDSDGPGIVGSYDDALGIQVLDQSRGELCLQVVPYVRNSFGAVNGGVVATLAQRAGRSVAVTRLGEDVRTSDVVVHYLNQARTGPLLTEAVVLRDGARSAQVRVELFDGGPPPETLCAESEDAEPAESAPQRVLVAVAHVRSELPEL